MILKTAEAGSGGKPIASWVKRFPPAYWELMELVLAGCPEDALKAYRRSLVVGKGKRLKASHADAAIRGAKGALARHHVEPYQGWMTRQSWYQAAGLPIVACGRWDTNDAKRNDASMMATKEKMILVVLTWDDAGVERMVTEP